MDTDYSERPNDPHARKVSWGPGPWQDEPDRLEWQDPTTGMPCLMVRGPLGALCGYVAVNPGHPAHGLQYLEGNALDDISVHGGLTYSAACQGSICHVPKPGEPDDVWWLGFDCAHMGDLVPKMAAQERAWEADGTMPKREYSLPFYMRDTYRDLAYVQAECAELASQLAAMAPAT